VAAIAIEMRPRDLDSDRLTHPAEIAKVVVFDQQIKEFHHSAARG
jgi:hypothetical protein